MKQTFVRFSHFTHNRERVTQMRWRDSYFIYKTLSKQQLNKLRALFERDVKCSRVESSRGGQVAVASEMENYRLEIAVRKNAKRLEENFVVGFSLIVVIFSVCLLIKLLINLFEIFFSVERGKLGFRAEE